MKRILVLLAVALTSTVSAQFKQKMADGLFEDREYFEAAPVYSELSMKTISKNKGDWNNLRKAALSYQRIFDYEKSVFFYEKLSQKGMLEEQDYMNYILALRVLRKYPLANELTSQALSTYPGNVTFALLDENKEKLSQLYEGMQSNQVEEMPFNSDKGDFSPFFYQDGLVFASKAVKKGFLVSKYGWDNANFINILFTEKATDSWSKPKALKDPFFTRAHDGPVAFDSTETEMVLTRNITGKRKGKEVIYLALYFAQKQLDGIWTEPEAFPFNNEAYNVGHACFSPDKQRIYFASDMPGGTGGTDLYYSERKAGIWQQPVNMGKEINTPLDELFPYVTNRNTLYFASNGHFGLGGLDLFKVRLTDAELFPSNLGYPINSSADDFGVITDSTFESGYFSSNREDFKDRIYAWHGTQVFEEKQKAPSEHSYALAGIVTDKESNAPVENAQVEMLNEKGTQVIETFKTTASGEFFSDVLKNNQFGDEVTFRFRINKEDYIARLMDVKQILDDRDTVLVAFVIERFEVGKDLGKMLALNIIYFDLNSSYIREDAKIELDKVVEVLNANPAMEIELSSHTDCRESVEYNRWLSDRRAKSSAEYVRSRIFNPTRVASKGYGESKLINDCGCEGSKVSNCTEEQHQANRRTEFRIVKK